MNNLLGKCIKNFHIYIYNDIIVINFILESPFHLLFLFFLNGFIDQSCVYGYS